MNKTEAPNTEIQKKPRVSWYRKNQENLFKTLNSKPEDWLVGKWGIPFFPRDSNITVCQLCGWKPLTNIFYLYNPSKFYYINVGSECVKNYIELRFGEKFDTWYDKEIVRLFKIWVSKFFTEYRYSEKTTSQRRLSQKVYEINKYDYKNANEIKRIFRRAQKNDFEIPKELFGYGIFV